LFGVRYLKSVRYLKISFLELNSPMWAGGGFMTIKQAQSTVDTWINTIGIRYYNELTNMAILTEEVGEVAKLMARLYGEQSFKTTEQEATAPQDLADEMADVLFVLICLANQTGIDLTEALVKNLDKKTKRDTARHANNKKLKSLP
jgi:NTP pyrophosphatase (non-canonical NTP hydrolase)